MYRKANCSLLTEPIEFILQLQKRYSCAAAQTLIRWINARRNMACFGPDDCDRIDYHLRCAGREGDSPIVAKRSTPRPPEGQAMMRDFAHQHQASV
jgi:hypothetical protein